MKIRYLAEWICSYDGPDDPNLFDHNCYRYATKPFSTFRQADLYARKQAKNGPVGGWWRVAEQNWNQHHYNRGVGKWSDLRAWVEGMETSA